MEHGVAIRTDRNQVVDRIDFILIADFRKLSQMMNVNKSFSEITESFGKIKSANTAEYSVVLQTSPSRSRVTFVGINCNPPKGSFPIAFRSNDLVR